MKTTKEMKRLAKFVNEYQSTEEEVREAYELRDASSTGVIYIHILDKKDTLKVWFDEKDKSISGEAVVKLSLSASKNVGHFPARVAEITYYVANELSRILLENLNKPEISIDMDENCQLLACQNYDNGISVYAKDADGETQTIACITPAKGKRVLVEGWSSKYQRVPSTTYIAKIDK